MESKYRNLQLRFFDICGEPGFEAAKIVLGSMLDMKSLYVNLKKRQEVTRIFWCESTKSVWLELYDINVTIFANGNVHFLHIKNRNKAQRAARLILDMIHEQPDSGACTKKD